MLEYMAPHVVRTFARAGFDWIWIDNEHGYQSYESIVHVTRTADDLGVITLVRVTQGDYPLIAQALDMAVSGVIVPRVETPDQVRRIIDCAKYPPIGKRGFGMRPSLWGTRRMSMAERIADQNERRFLVVQLECPRALDNLDKMLDVAEGQLDAVFFGPSDYQVAIGKPDSPDLPELVAAARHLTSTCAKHGVSNGVPATSVETAQRWVDLGFNLITFKSDDQFMVDGAFDGREALRTLESQ
jgi:2-keto-3-deoxy-L-rhamnonate aldolase RhmA